METSAMQSFSTQTTKRYSWDHLPDCAALLKEWLDDAVESGKDDLAGQLQDEIEGQIRIENQRMDLIGKVLTEEMDYVVLANSRGDQWAMVLPDASEAGSYRWQSFDSNGFIGHATYPCKVSAVSEAFYSGFRTLDAEALYRVSTLPSFSRGNEVLAEIQALNSGQITHEQYIARVKEINQRYENVLAA